MGTSRSAMRVVATLLLLPALIIGGAVPHAHTSGTSVALQASKILGLAAFPYTGSTTGDNLIVDLGYGKYRGVHNKTSRIRSWKGIPFAEPPVGQMRWQRPQPPKKVVPGVQDAIKFGSQCPQTPLAIPGFSNGPGLPGFPLGPGSEDCLYVNVFSPDVTSGSARGVKKPVLVWIHGGGYGFGNGANDLTDFVTDNNNEFVIVTIQYRLGAFGFLSSADMKDNGGTLNAGLLDQSFALMWVQTYISYFGGDATQVTISGESAGGGSVMYQTLSTGGNKDLKLFHNAIAASPYLTPQYDYDAKEPTERYYAFAKHAGCNTSNYTSNGSVFKCLVEADTMALQYASFNVSESHNIYGTWAFVPVTDGTLVQDLPTRQLAAKKTIGSNIMVGNNANEGGLFVPTGIETDSDLVDWIKMAFPGLSSSNITELLEVYSTAGLGPNQLLTDPYTYPADGPKFETDGEHWPTASDVSMQASGRQQRANNIYGEATFACTAYYLAEAFTQSTRHTRKQTAFQYQYSIVYAYHSVDIFGYLGPRLPSQSRDFVKTFRQMWGGLVVRSNPTVLPWGGASTPYVFPAWTLKSRPLVNLNSTGGVLTNVTQIYGEVGAEYRGETLRNEFKTVDSTTWEGGRGKRCDFLRTLGPLMHL